MPLRLTKKTPKSIEGTIFYAKSTGRLPPDLGVNNASAIDYSAIKLLPPAVKAEVLHVVSGSIRVRVADYFLQPKTRTLI